MVLKKTGSNEKDTRYIFFSGKGGVGKTSVAAATALSLSKKGKNTLIISTDPAHSLSDSFDTNIGGEVKKICRNLHAVEIDPELSMNEYKELLSPQLEKMKVLRGLGLDETFDMAGMTPGIDEIASFDRFLRFIDSKEYDAIVFDTAPTGHTLRLLSLPDVLDTWVGKIIKIRIRFSGIAGMVKRLVGSDDADDKDVTLERLEEMKKRIGHAKDIMTNPDKTSYNIVMIPEAMSIYESERSVRFLEGARIPIDRVIVNQIIPENSGCRFCTEKRKHQLERITEIKKSFCAFRVMELLLFREEVRGKRMLDRVARELYG